jgi:regulatory protein
MITDDELYERLVNAVFRFLSVRPRSRKEIADYLRKKTSKNESDTSAVIEKVINRMTELGYIDDFKFAQWWVEQRQAFKPKGDQFIKRELMVKGVDRDLIDQALTQSDTSSQKELALTAVRKKLPLWSKLPLIMQKQKLYSFLGRQGFDSDTIRSTIDEVTGKDYNSQEE